METSGFYKNDNGDLLYAPNFVLNASYELVKAEKDNYAYPVDGWTWFESEDDARLFFGMEKKPEQI